MSVSAAPAAVEIPFLDLGRIHRDLAETFLSDFQRLIETGEFTNGAHVAAFEREFAAYCQTAECVGVSSGLDALRLALLAAGAAPGDEVLVPANTFIATVEGVLQAACRPVLVDADERDYCMSMEAAAAAVGRGTRFVLPVHLYGQMADVRALSELCDRHGLALVEDACQAHGAQRDGLRAGSAGLAAAFSFYPAKNLGALGDAGALVTSDPHLAQRARALREHGQREKYRHSALGYTARLDTIHAAVLLRKLPLLDQWNAERVCLAATYSELLDGLDGLVVPHTPSGSTPVWHLYVVRVDDPAGLAAHLERHGIRTGRHYPEPVHLSEACRGLGYGPGDFPVAEALAGQLLSLPIFPGMTQREVHAVAEAVAEFVRNA
jgi:dTDP-3-amino-3,4,6-trideoxy-alpha-D-glucose transaminase